MGNHKLLKAGGINSRYSMCDFLNAIKINRIIWDRDHESFHNRELRDQAWQDIGRQLCSNYNELTFDEKNEIAKTLQKRWKNTRDSFLRVHRLRQSSNEPTLSTYIYERELSFLLDANEEYPSKTRMVNKQIKKEKLNATSTKRKTRAADAATNASAYKTRAKKARQNDMKTECTNYDDSQSSLNEDSFDLAVASRSPGPAGLLKSDFKGSLELNEAENVEEPSTAMFRPSTSATGGKVGFLEAQSQTPTTPVVAADPDQAFFDTIKPYIQKMDDNQKLDFQIEILRLVRQFKT